MYYCIICGCNSFSFLRVRVYVCVRAFTSQKKMIKDLKKKVTIGRLPVIDQSDLPLEKVRLALSYRPFDEYVSQLRLSSETRRMVPPYLIY